MRYSCTVGDSLYFLLFSIDCLAQFFEVVWLLWLGWSHFGVFEFFFSIEKLSFCQKTQFLSINSVSVEKLSFCQNAQFLLKSLKVCQKFKFLSKKLISVKISFSVRRANCQKSYLPKKLSLHPIKSHFPFKNRKKISQN